MRVSGDQAKTTCVSLYFCAGLKAGIEREKHAVGEMWGESKEGGTGDM